MVDIHDITQYNLKTIYIKQIHILDGNVLIL